MTMDLAPWRVVGRRLARRAEQAIAAPVPGTARQVLALIPPTFRDDGCSWWLDGLAGISWRWACRIHDWRGCSRAHVPGALSPAMRRLADAELRRNILSTVPIGWVVLPAVTWLGLSMLRGAGSWDTCAPPNPRGATSTQLAQGLCRHDLPIPAWWDRLAGAADWGSA